MTPRNIALEHSGFCIRRYSLSEAIHLFNHFNGQHGTSRYDRSRVKAVGRRADFETLSDARNIDLKGWSLLPGLMDTHIHLDGWETTNRFDWVVMPDAQRALNAAAYAKRALDAGFTFVRDAGSNIGVSLKRVIEEGKLPGPRMRVSVKGIYQTNGQGDRAYMPIEWVKQKENCVLVDGEVECRRAVRLMPARGGRLYQDCYVRRSSFVPAALYTERSRGNVR